DFIGLAVHSHLAQRQVGLRGPGADQVQRPEDRTSRAAQRLAVDGDVADADQSRYVPQPRQTAALNGPRVQRGEDPLERGVRRTTNRRIVRLVTCPNQAPGNNWRGV